MLSIAEGSFEVFVVFQRDPGGNASPLSHTQSDTHICILFTHTSLRVNGREGIKQHAPVCITGRISVALMVSRFSAAMLMSQQQDNQREPIKAY